MDLERLEKEVIDLARNAGEFISSQLGKVNQNQIEEKELNSLVSYVDKQAEIQLVKGLSELMPGSAFLTEENTVRREKSKHTWIVDPLDGTNNFLHKIPHFAVSIALQVDLELKLGIVLDVIRNECYHAVKGQGAYVDGNSIAVSATKTLQESLIGTGFPYTNDYNIQLYLDALGHWLKSTRGIRRFGAAALDLIYVACGKLDAFYETNLNPWDVAAGILIVQEAGGQVSDFFGEGNFHDGSQILASNAQLHADLISVLSGIYQKTVYQDT